MNTIKIYAWHPSACKIIEKTFEGKWDNEYPLTYIINDKFNDIIGMLNNAGLNVIVPKDYKEKKTLFVDTSMFRQR